MKCDIPIPRLLRDDERDALGYQVSAESPKRFIRLRPVDAGEDDQVKVVTPAPAVAPGAAVAVMSMDDVARHSEITDQVTAIRDALLRARTPGP